jgi:outer membrane protein insertion porin family
LLGFLRVFIKLLKRLRKNQLRGFLRSTPNRHYRGFIFCFFAALSFLVLLGHSDSAIAQNFGGGPRARPMVPKKNNNAPVPVAVPDVLAGELSDNSVVTDAQGEVSKIEVKGNRKIETDSVLSHLRTKLGGEYSPTLLREDIARLFKTGYFYDVQVDRVVDTSAEASKGGKPGPHYVLTYIVVEKPSIAEITFTGTSELKNEELLETSGLKTYEILSNSKIRDAAEKMQKMYEDKGFFLARIDPKIEDVKPGETVRVVFNVNENDKVKVKKITFLGNGKLKDGFLKQKMITQEGGFFSFMSGGGGYKQDAFDRDMQLLRVLYFNEGYVQVKIDRPKVYVTPDKKSIYITIRIEEGEQFDVGEIDFSGDLLFPKEELAAAIALNKRKIFSYEVLQKDLGDLQAKYGDLGYAFANVIPRTKTNEKDRKVDVTFEFDKGNKVYFGQINVIGNSKTRDKVVRRELKIFEGELYNETRKRQSQENIQRLGFFEDVTFKTSTPPDKPDLLNIDIVVKERNTGSIQLGAGYGSATGFSLQGQIQQANFLGYGQKMGAGVTSSSQLTTYFFNFTEPHYNDTDYSVGFDIYQSTANRVDYIEAIRGGSVRVGHPLAEFLNLTMRYRYDITWLDVVSVTPAPTTAVPVPNSIIVTDPVLFPLNTAQGDTGSVSAIIEYDHRNDRIAPTAGAYASGSYEYAGVGGSLNYSKASTGFRYYKKLFWDLVWRNNMSYSYLQSTGGQAPPFNQRFLLGGPYTLRGYQFARIGKTKFGNYYYGILPTINPGIAGTDQYNQANRPIGGTQQALYQLEFEFPLIAEANIKGVTFYDAGIADDSLDASNLYSDVGFGFRWFSPIGPLRFEWGFPIQSTVQSPNPVQFQFSIGAPF